MSARPKTLVLSEQQAALHGYLEALLADVPDYEPESEASPAPVAPVTPVTLEVVTGEPPPAPVVVAPPVVETPPVLEAPLVEAPVVEVPVDDPPLARPEPRAGSAAPPSAVEGAPDWAAGPFPCLVFDVGGVNLAVPLVHLNGVLPWPEQVTPMPGHSELFVGLHPHQGRNVKVIDTGRIVLPEGRRPPTEGEGSYGNIVLIDEGRWGLACQSVADTITLDPARVKWRSAGGRRPWLAGTVIDHMCALLDVSAFARMLEHGDEGGAEAGTDSAS